jgi:hypothetical protein
MEHIKLEQGPTSANEVRHSVKILPGCFSHRSTTYGYTVQTERNMQHSLKMHATEIDCSGDQHCSHLPTSLEYKQDTPTHLPHDL